MKKTLLLMLALCGGMTAQAQELIEPLTESPWTTVASAPAEGTYYLYNVESGLWLQNNRRWRDAWTTYVQLGPHGFDFVLTKNEDGQFKLDPRFGRNHSVNGGDNAYGYMDTDQPETWWDIVQKGIGYEISANAGSHYLYVSQGLIENVVDNGWVIDDLGDGGTWQFVSKEARMADLEKATKTEPKDATWLIDAWDFANMDDRNASWKNEVTGSASGVAFNQGWWSNRAAEIWSKGHGEFYQVITGLPNGTYGLTVQGYYRDGSTSGVYDKYVNGEEVIRGWFFANDATQPLMSICDNGVTEPIQDVYDLTSGFYGPGDGGSALPRASNGFYLGYYKNPELKVVVTDGTLRIGIRKDSDTQDDWLVFDNFELTYYGSGIDIDEGAIEEAGLNFANSPWGERLTATLADFNDMAQEGSYDLIVSNPPYFTDSLLPPDSSRTLARHTCSLTYRQLIEGATRLLTSEGSLAMISPTDAEGDIIEAATFASLPVRRVTRVIPVEGAAPKRTLWHLSRRDIPHTEDTLTITHTDGTFTEEYINLTKEFYLKM